MKKYYDKKGEEFKVGNLAKVGVINHETGITEHIITSITEGILEKAVEDGLLFCKEEEGGTHLDVSYYVEHLAKRIGWKVENLENYLSNLYSIYPAAVFSVILREIAIVLDKKYPDHIEKSKEIWCISTSSGRIQKMSAAQRERVVNFKNFAAFRNLQDALCAKHILKVPMKDLFSKNKSGK